MEKTRVRELVDDFRREQAILNEARGIRADPFPDSDPESGEELWVPPR